MPTSPRRAFGFTILAATLLSVLELRAQETTVKDLQQRIASVQDSTELDEATRAKIVEDLKAAISHLERLPGLVQAGDDSRKTVEEGQARIAEQRAELDKLLNQPPPPSETIRKEAGLADDSPSAVVETAWRSVVAALNELKNQRDMKAAAIKNEELRPTKIETEELPQLRAKLEEITKGLAESQPPDVPPARWSARRELLLARQRARLAEQLALQQEQLASPLRLDFLKAERDVLARKITLQEARERVLDEFLKARRQAEDEEARKRQEEALSQEVGKHPLVRDLVAENQRLSEEKTEIEAKAKGASEQSERLRNATDMLKKAYDSTVDLLAVAESGLDMANVLRQRREELLASVTDVESERTLQERLTRASVRQAEIGDLIQSFSDPAEESRLLESASQGELGERGREKLEALLRQQLADKKKYLDDLEKAYGDYTRNLPPVLRARRELIAAAEPLGALIDEGLMWMPSGEPFTHATLPIVFESALQLGGEFAPTALWNEVQSLSWGRQVLIVLALLYALGILCTRGRWRDHTAFVNRKLGRVHEDSFWFTTNALVLTTLRAGLWALPIWSLAVLPSIGPGLSALAPFLFFMHLLWLLLQPTGMGVAHFRWDKATVADVRANMRWLAPTLCLAAFVVSQLERTASIEETHGLGRLFVMIGLTSLGLFFARIFRRAGPLVTHLAKSSSQSWLFRLRRLWWAFAVLAPLALVLAAALGWYYTCLRLATPMTRSIQLALLVFFVQAIVFRFLAIAQRRLALARAIEKREAALAKGEEPEDLPQVESPEFDLSTINQQTRHLIRTFMGLGLILVLWFAWKGTIAAFTVFDDVPVWTTSLPDGNGGTIEGAVTLGDLALVFIIAVGTVAAARNLPGVLEILVLKHLPLDSGGRYATTTISRYVITATGIVLAFDAIGIGWSDVQWLVAALGVGLGFGLQEIFANFVCGLIIFFERRVRVGDVVTVDGIDGVVSKIRILGTTITNWDRKEYVVPNKEFVTGRLLNWTLSDTINRLVLSVGVAYGSDTQKALDLLMEAAREHPMVLEDPAPFATFEVFGDSTLNLNLRCYLPDLSGRMRTLTELNQAIDRKFRAAGLEIAFPQRDLHVRSIELPPHLLRTREED
ncbi:MAG: mechanosensitive ion channel [Planctomycetes bacterium]|nr:mechanosensitive ion channel [Planctomycetota bacterium]